MRCGIKNVKWNLYCEDSLKKEFDFKFDYVIGNPPYLKQSEYKEVFEEVNEEQGLFETESNIIAPVKEEVVEVKEEPVVVPQPEKKDVFLNFDEDEFERFPIKIAIESIQVDILYDICYVFLWWIFNFNVMFLWT